MLGKLFDQGGKIIDVVGHLDRQQWIVVLFVAVVIGFFCLRGFGSRTAY